MKRSLQFVLFLVCGIPLLSINLIVDCYYFWTNNFRSDLKMIIIEKQESPLKNESIRGLKLICSRYTHNKIKSLNSSDFVKTFRKRFLVKDNIQYILFGQMIPENGFGNNTTL